ncbi:MAG: hypothetical protein JO246_14960 [Frankiaceae bacterium]|nr:hypothetical protein [Frankiaceae bacterium]MBV9872570.1 hypothetical protein [Frankiaceae bacterium]
MTEPPDESRPLSLDPEAETTDPTLPAFLARPEGAPAYYGFPVIGGVEVDGFRIGAITDFPSEPSNDGDAFVVAPDGTRAGLVWEANCPYYFEQVLPPDNSRWGVWAVGVPLPLGTVEHVAPYLTAILSDLRRRWEDWQ